MLVSDEGCPLLLATSGLGASHGRHKGTVQTFFGEGQNITGNGI